MLVPYRDHKHIIGMINILRNYFPVAQARADYLAQLLSHVSNLHHFLRAE